MQCKALLVSLTFLNHLKWCKNRMFCLWVAERVQFGHQPPNVQVPWNFASLQYTEVVLEEHGSYCMAAAVFLIRKVLAKYLSAERSLSREDRAEPLSFFSRLLVVDPIITVWIALTTCVQSCATNLSSSSIARSALCMYLLRRLTVPLSQAEMQRYACE